MPPRRACFESGSGTPDVAAVMHTHSQLPRSTTPPRIGAADPPALFKPTPPAAGPADRTSRKSGVQFHGMNSHAASSADGKDGGGSSNLDSAGPMPMDASPRKQTTQDVSGSIGSNWGLNWRLSEMAEKGSFLT